MKHLSEYEKELLEALKTWEAFWDDMPKGQLGKITCDIGLLNEAFLKTRAAIKKSEAKSLTGRTKRREKMNPAYEAASHELDTYTMQIVPRKP